MAIAAILVFLSVLFLFLFFLSFRQEKKGKVKDRLENFFSEAELQQANLEINDKEEEGKRKARKKGFLKKEEENNQWRKKMLDELSQAGVPLRPEEYLMLRLLGGAVLALIFLLAANLVLMLVGFVAGFYFLPTLFINRKKRVRINHFNYQLSSALSTMANSLRAGFSLFQAMKSLSSEMSPPLSTEFSRTLKEINLGTPTEQALQNMSARVKSEDLDLVVLAINIQRQVGGNLAEVLENIAHTIQERIRVQREIKTLTAQGRISGIIIGLLPVFLALAIFLLNPEYMGSFFAHPLGYVLTAMGLFSQFIGVMMIRKIVDIKW